MRTTVPCEHVVCMYIYMAQQYRSTLPNRVILSLLEQVACSNLPPERSKEWSEVYEVYIVVRRRSSRSICHGRLSV